MENPDHYFWNVLRKAAQAIIILFLLALSLFILVIIVIHPKCETLPQRLWWENAMIYRLNLHKVCLNSLKGECFSDLIEKIDYFRKLNANGLLITDIVDLSGNFTVLNKDFGSKEEFQTFLNYSHSKNIRILMDFIPNYTTDENLWFKRSLEDPKYKNYYIWSKVPNNWVCFKKSCENFQL
jgi:hypothetical protein